MNILTLPQRTDLDFDRATVLLVTAAGRFTDLAGHLPMDWLVLHREGRRKQEERRERSHSIG